MQSRYQYPPKRRDAAARHRPDEACGYSYREVAAAISSEGGPDIMREVWRKFGGAVYPATYSPYVPSYHVSLAEHRTRHIVDLATGATATRPTSIKPGIWQEVGRALVSLGYLDQVDLETYRRTAKEGPMPITPEDVKGEIQRAKHGQARSLSSRNIREQYVCTLAVGFSVERPDNVLAESWRIAVQPLCRLGFLEPIAKGHDKFHAVKRLAKNSRIPADNFEINAMTRRRYGRNDA